MKRADDVRSALAGRPSGTAWIDQEMAGSHFADERLGRRLQKLLAQLAARAGSRSPMACQDGSNTKAAYRFLSNERVSEAEILAGHFHPIRERFAATRGWMLVAHDTTELSFNRESMQAVGMLGTSFLGRDDAGRARHHTVCGSLMHSSPVLTREGLPLGLAAIRFWTRDKFKGCKALKRSINPTRVPIEEMESVRWLDSLRQRTEWLGAAQRCVHVWETGRATWLSSSARP